MVPASSTATSSARSARDVVGVVADAQTWKHLLYVLLAFPLGMAYYGLLLFGLVFGVVLSVVGVGLAILVGVVYGVRGLASFERWLANALLGLDLEAPDDVDSSTAGDALSSIRATLDAPSTWRGMGVVAAKFPLGIAALVPLVFVSVSVRLLTAPVRYPFTAEFGTVNEEPVTWSIGTLPEAILALALGLVLGIAVLHLANGFAYAAGRMAEALLGDAASAEEAGAASSR